MSSDADKSEAKEFKLGEESLSDVIFIVGDCHFHCHRMALATRFPYFNTMFTSDFKEKTEKLIKIEADPMAFKRLMEILYNGIFEDHEEFFNRETYGKNSRDRCLGKHSSALWSESYVLFELADRFLVLDIVRNAFESYMVLANRNCEGIECRTCATKLLLSFQFNLNHYKDICRANRITIFSVVDYLEPIQKKYTLSSDAMRFLLTRS